METSFIAVLFLEGACDQRFWLYPALFVLTAVICITLLFSEKGKMANECYWPTNFPSEGRNFCLEKGEYCIFFDPNSKRIDIHNINEKKE